MSAGIIEGSTGTRSPVSGESDKPWYRQFWPWFLIALPATAVIASLYTVYLAASDPDALVVDDYARIGKATHLRQERDRMAADLGARADVSLETPGKIVVQLDLDAPRPEDLWLVLSHPTLAERDRQIPLSFDGIVWSGVLDVDPASRWYLQIGPENGNWRLAGQLDQQQTRLQLTPPETG